ncbi:MAG: T9SS type A sorting domain-containing protein [Crocinitomicaceae bacterium]
MKTTKLFLTFALIGIFQLAYAQWDVIATGQLTNTNAAAISVNLNFYDGASATSASVLTDINGYYSHTFTGTATSNGTVELIVHDCNNDTIYEVKSYNVSTGDTLVNFTTADYCPNIAPPATTNVYASGNLTNTSGAAINVSLVLFDGNGNTITATAVTNPNGNYSHTFSTSATSQGTVYMQVQDCNSDSIFETKPYNLNTYDSIVVFTSANYCPVVVPPTGCQAYFDVSQATTQGGNAVAGTLVVTDSSFASSPLVGLTYTWSFGDGSSGTGTQLTHTYAGNGPYVLCLTINDTLGCTDTYCDTISVDSNGTIIEAEGFDLVIGAYDAPLSISDNDLSSSVKVFPNPATDFINVQFNTGDKALNKITVYDLSGKVIYEDNNTTTSNNITSISIDGIAPGTYLIQMLFDSEIYNEKVIIK